MSSYLLSNTTPPKPRAAKGKRIAKISLSSPYCHIEVTAVEVPTTTNTTMTMMSHHLSSAYYIDHAADACKCKCRVHSDEAQERRNDKVLFNHVHNLQYVDGVSMATVFAKLKTGSNAVEPEHMLPWDEDAKTWISPRTSRHQR